MIIILLAIVSLILMAAYVAMTIAAVYMEEANDRKNHTENETSKAD